MNEKSIKALSIDEASKVFGDKNKFFKYYMKDTNLKISTIQNSNIFNDFLSNPNDTDVVNSLFMDIAGTSDNIMQLRYVDKSGNEIIRVQRAEFASKPYQVKKRKLQNKSERYYFKDTLGSPENSFYYSSLDLNREYSKIQIPIQPVIRVGSPVFHNGKKSGVIIINIFMKNFLQELINIPLFDVYLFDGDGNIIIDSISY